MATWGSEVILTHRFFFFDGKHLQLDSLMQRPDPMIPCKPGAEDLTAMNNRNSWITMLYLLEGRDKPDHPKRGLYTGLHKKHFSTFPGTDEN